MFPGLRVNAVRVRISLGAIYLSFLTNKRRKLNVALWYIIKHEILANGSQLYVRLPPAVLEIISLFTFVYSWSLEGFFRAPPFKCRFRSISFFFPLIGITVFFSLNVFTSPFEPFSGWFVSDSLSYLQTFLSTFLSPNLSANS